jgi:hypothetical protein
LRWRLDCSIGESSGVDWADAFCDDQAYDWLQLLENKDEAL